MATTLDLLTIVSFISQEMWASRNLKTHGHLLWEADWEQWEVSC
jgi:hypothetical protein